MGAVWSLPESESSIYLFIHLMQWLIDVCQFLIRAMRWLKYFDSCDFDFFREANVNQELFVNVTLEELGLFRYECDLLHHSLKFSRKGNLDSPDNHTIIFGDAYFVCSMFHWETVSQGMIIGLRVFLIFRYVHRSRISWLWVDQMHEQHDLIKTVCCLHIDELDQIVSHSSYAMLRSFTSCGWDLVMVDRTGRKSWSCQKIWWLGDWPFMGWSLTLGSPDKQKLEEGRDSRWDG